MSEHRMRISVHVAERLREHHLAAGKSREAISLALGHAYIDDQGHATVVLADPGALFLFDEDCYELRGFAQAVLSTEVRAAVCWKAVQEGFSAVVDIHDHHFADGAWFSSVDDRDERNTERYFRDTLPRFLAPGQRLFAASLLLARQDWAARTVWFGPDAVHGEPMRVDQIGSFDAQLSAGPLSASRARFARQRAVIGDAKQARIQRLHAAVVGAGGTGSIMAETLCRLGFGRVTLIDGDRVEETNLHRLQGATPADVGRLKVDVLAQRLLAAVPGTRVTPVAQEAFDPAAVRHLERADLIVGCVDNAESRWWLNRFAMQYLVPYFDCGVLIQVEPAVVMHMRAHAIIPGAGPCGHCTPLEFFPPQRPTRFLDAATLLAQRSAGYVTDTASTMNEAAIYPLNLQVVGLLAQEILAWVNGHRAVAHTVFQRSDRTDVERLTLDGFGGGGAEDCPLCATLAGRCQADRLPSATADETTTPLNPKETCNGQVQP